MKQIRNTRMEILALLKKRGAMTAQQVGEVMKMTSMGARQHLTSLESDQLVESDFVRQKTGRPALYFRLTDKADHYFPQRYDSLALSFLRNLEEMEGREKVEEILRRRKEKLLVEYKKILNSDNVRERVQKIAEIRDNEGYMAEFKEEEDGGLNIIEYNCPITCIANDFPEICQHELELFEEVLGCPVERQDHMIQGTPACVYKIREPKK
ncbi:MAG: helix-turn-helix transcriptional regulator [bacterium]